MAYRDYIQYDEKMLLSLVATGDRIAFTHLYKTHLDHAWNFAILFTHSQDEAKELVQETFVKVWESREKLSKVNSFRNYLLRSVKNLSIDYVRRNQVRHRVMTEIKRNSEASAETTESGLSYKQYYLIIQEAIEKLPPSRRLIFRLSTENGLTLDEIAVKLGISKPVVKKQLYKAFDFVRSYLTSKGDLSLSIMFLVCFA